MATVAGVLWCPPRRSRRKASRRRCSARRRSLLCSRAMMTSTQLILTKLPLLMTTEEDAIISRTRRRRRRRRRVKSCATLRRAYGCSPICASRNASHARANLREAVSGCSRAKIQRALRERQQEEAAAAARRRAATSPPQRASSSAPMMGGGDADATNTAVSTEGQRCSVCRKPIKVRSRFRQNGTNHRQPIRAIPRLRVYIYTMTAARRLTPFMCTLSSRPACVVGGCRPYVRMRVPPAWVPPPSRVQWLLQAAAAAEECGAEEGVLEEAQQDAQASNARRRQETMRCVGGVSLFAWNGSPWLTSQASRAPRVNRWQEDASAEPVGLRRESACPLAPPRLVHTQGRAWEGADAGRRGLWTTATHTRVQDIIYRAILQHMPVHVCVDGWTLRRGHSAIICSAPRLLDCSTRACSRSHSCSRSRLSFSLPPSLSPRGTGKAGTVDDDQET
eukprot:COSAG01_NODE_10816_length_2074_cov_4.755443_2_plen_449_part_00